MHPLHQFCCRSDGSPGVSSTYGCGCRSESWDPKYVWQPVGFLLNQPFKGILQHSQTYHQCGHGSLNRFISSHLEGVNWWRGGWRVGSLKSSFPGRQGQTHKQDGDQSQQLFDGACKTSRCSRNVITMAQVPFPGSPGMGGCWKITFQGSPLYSHR